MKHINKQDICGISAISCWEVAMLENKNRIKFSFEINEWMKLAVDFPKIKLLEITPEISIKSANLVDFHGAPADRIIFATAIVNNAKIITKDKLISNYNNDIAVW